MSYKKCILVIEDNKDILFSLQYILQEQYEVLPASTGAKALILLEQKIPDLIILDLMLPPSLDGFAILKVLKFTPEYVNIPVIILSALSEESKIIQGLEGGANDYLTKPYRAQELLLKVKNLLSIINGTRTNNQHQRIIESRQIASKKISAIEKFELLAQNKQSFEDLSIPEIAKEIGVSVSKLERICKLKFGVTPKQYIINLRLSKAEMLLRDNKRNIKEVTYEVGFNSTSYFCVKFKEKYGVTPKYYLGKMN